MSAGVVSVLRAHSPVVLSHDGGTVEGCACGRWSPPSSSSDADGWAEHADHVAGELLADLRAGIERIACAVDADGQANVAPALTLGVVRDDLRALLAGSGEQPGACDRSGEWCRTHREAWPCQAGLIAGTLTTDDVRPAPVVPDSPDVYETIRAFIEEEVGFDGGPGMDDQARRLTDRVLAVVGQGMTAEPVAVVERIHEDWPVITARVYAPESWKHLGLGAHLHAAVRPTGQEQS